MISGKKSRNLFNPEDTNKAVPGWMNFNLLRISKAVNHSFIHGMNTE
jgi:hypothetical protein